jgi:diguanylate cyclase (GGDEF)-like protein/PAS domain S-box-containing protein
MNQMSADNGEAGIYIIDQEYRIIYMNDMAKTYYPDLKAGMYCYEELGKNSVPCKVCPGVLNDTGQVIFYDAASKLWLNLTSGQIDWPGYQGSRLIMFRPVGEQNKNLFYSLTNNTTYEELFELNLISNTYKIIFSEKDKFKLPAEEGELLPMYTEVLRTMIHPSDRDEFLKFWDRLTLLDRLNESEKILKGEFRRQLLDGGYRWVSLTVVLFLDEFRDESLVMCYIKDIDSVKKKEEEQKQQQEKRDETDSLTGLLRYGPFFDRARQFLEQRPQEHFFMIAIDIEHFKLYNEWYGEEEGDRFLIKISEHLIKMESTRDTIAGYMGGDDFVIIQPQDSQLLKELEEEINCYARQYGGNAGFLPAFGIYCIEDRDLTVSTMYDRAIIALNSVKGNYAKRIGWYDPGMKRKMENDQVLLSEIQMALENKEFIFYAQPQCNMLTGKIVGMESLVRWEHPKRGIITPGEFIPLLEQNGFITHLDVYIWEMVCQQLSTWIKAGIVPIPISVNMSRMDLYGINVVETFKELAEKYEIDPKYLEIEITESAYAEDYDLIRKVVEDLRRAGFPVFMDDFGSGYSSLNMLKDVNVDVIKIDTKFLDMNENSIKRGMGILETIVRMARVMQFKVVAEGIEEKEQADFLINIGCIYGQGYYYYKPMTVNEVEALLRNEKNLDYRGIQARQMKQLKLEDLFNEDITSEAMLNNMLGAIALYEVFEDHCEVLRVNEEYYRITGDNPVDGGDRRKFMLHKVYKDDIDWVLRIFENAYKNPVHGAEGIFRRYRLSGELMWVHLRVFFLREQDERRLYYGTVQDATEQMEQRKKLEDSQKILSEVLKLAGRNLSFDNLAEENQWAASAIFAQAAPGGLLGVYCEPDLPLYFANNEMLSLMGYDSYERFFRDIGGKIVDIIHPDDRGLIREVILCCNDPGMEYNLRHRIRKQDGNYLWIMTKGRTVQAEDGRLAVVSACMDVTNTVLAEQNLKHTVEVLEKKEDELEFLSSGIPGGYFRCSKGNAMNFQYTSSRFHDIIGHGREEMAATFQGSFLEMVHPDDREAILRMSEELCPGTTLWDFEYRVQTKTGIITVLSNFRISAKDDTTLYGVMIDRRDMEAYHTVWNDKKETALTVDSQEIWLPAEVNGVMDRMGFQDRLRGYLERERFQTSSLAVFEMSCPNSEHDQEGKLAKALFSKQVTRLKSFFRQEDLLCLNGGYEVVVLCKNIRESDIEMKVSGIIKNLNQEMSGEEKRLFQPVRGAFAMIGISEKEFNTCFKKARGTLSHNFDLMN